MTENSPENAEVLPVLAPVAKRSGPAAMPLRLYT